MKLLLTFAMSLLAIAAFAANSAAETQQIKIVVDTGAGDEPVTIELDSDKLGFSLSDLADGESRSVVDESGQTVLITRHGDDFQIDVDDQKFEIPAIGGDDVEQLIITDSDATDVDVRIIKRGGPMGHKGPDDIVIVSGKALDQSVKDDITAVLTAAGNTGQITFVDRSEHEHHMGGLHEGKHHVKIIRKTIEQTP